MSTTLITAITDLIWAVGFIACAALTLYTLMERSTLNAASRRIVSQSTVLTALGTLFFFGVTAAAFGTNSNLSIVGTATPLTWATNAPSTAAFAIFAVAIPVMLQILTNLVSFNEAASRIAARMISASILMVTASYIATGVNYTGASETTATVFAALALVSYGYILTLLYNQLPQETTNNAQAYRTAFANCRSYFTYSTAAYVAVSALTQFNVLGEATPLAGLIAALATLTLFTAISFQTMTTGREVSRSGMNSSANDVDITVSGISTASGRKKSKAA